MYILHIETATKICSVALSKGEQLVAYRESNEGMNHASALTPFIEGLLKEKGLDPGDLGAVSISAGPGSYTGLRVGAATAKAISYTIGIPLLGVPTLEALAWAAFVKYPEAQLVIPMLDARRNEVYTASYGRSLQQIKPVSSLIVSRDPPEYFIKAGGQTIICGDGSFKAMGWKNTSLEVDTEILSSATHLIGPAFRLFTEGIFSDALHFVPFYLKPPNITQPKASV